MKLLNLSSSIKTFKPVAFNREGLTIILAERNEQKTTEKASFNGVGKSLIIYLIHFCLGNQNNKDFQNKLPNEYFELEFEIESKVCKARRWTTEQDYIYLNDNKLKIKEFETWIKEKAFPNSSTKFITFNQLISRFIRPFTHSYASWNKWLPKEDKNEHVVFLNTLYLFGFNADIMHKKYELKDKLKDYENKLKSFKKDPVLTEYFTDSKKDISIDAENIKQIIKSKESKLKNLNFSEDYYDIETKTENIAIELRTLNNHKILLEHALSNIEESLKNDFSKNTDFVTKAYNNLKESMKEDALEELSAVLTFHNSLLNNRQKRLKEEKNKIIKEIDNSKKRYQELTAQHNTYLELLNKNAPFEQGLAIKDDINQLTQKLKHLLQHDEIIETYKLKISTKKQEIEAENKSSEEYLKEIKDLRLEMNTKFNELVNKFYENKDSYITVKNNNGNNTIRFNLNVKIEDDSSNGVREIEIFCFDILLFEMRKNTTVDFIFHDSRLFANVDPTQMTIAFKIINDLIEKTNCQYIISLNENQQEDIKNQFERQNNAAMLDKLFNKDTIRLTLTKDDAGKLLGFQKDLNYDKS